MGEPKLPNSNAEKKREDVNTTTSEMPGLQGYLETFLRRFRTVSFLLLISPLALICCICVGVPAGAGLLVFDLCRELTLGWSMPLKYMGIGIGFALGYLTYGLTLLFFVPAVNFIIPFKPKPFRGPWFSLAAIPWYIHNGLTYMVRYTFLEFVTPTPLNILFYRMMGMKIGRGVVINTTNISDPCMISLGDYVTVGGSATIFAHYGQKGYLIIAPVTVGKGTNIGLKASIMGGAQIGEGVTIKPHVCVLPKTVVPDGETV